MREGLRVIPNMGARAMAATSIREAAFPTPELAIFEAQNRGGFDDTQIRGDGVEHIRRESRREQCLFEGHRAAAQRVVVLFDVECNLACVVPTRDIERTPERRRVGREKAATRCALRIALLGSATDLQVAVGEMPSNSNAMGSRLA